MNKAERYCDFRSALSQFDANFLLSHRILFGGFMRIAMEIDVFKHCSTIQFFCPSIESFRAVREQIYQDFMGGLVSKPFDVVGEIKTGNGYVIASVKVGDSSIKVEFLSCSKMTLYAESQLRWGVPVLNRDSCYLISMLSVADSDRADQLSIVVELVEMHAQWGEPSSWVWEEMDSLYGPIARNSVISALQDIVNYLHSAGPDQNYCDRKYSTRPDLKEAAQRWLSALSDKNTTW